MGLGQKRGFVLTLDVTIAAFILFAVMAVIFIFIVKSGGDKTPEAIEQKISNDIISVLHKKGVLQTFDQSNIQSNLNLLMPTIYDMRLEIKKYSVSGNSTNLVQNITVGSNLPTENKTIIGGKRVFIGQNGTYYGSADYFIWLK